jgi:ABC-type branched-subunit amino acid transport system ATPase component
MTAVVEVRGLTRRFGGVVALDSVTFSISPGEVFAIIGPNGAGKTTLLNLMTGLDRSPAGTVRLDGRDITAWPAWQTIRAGIGRTLQSPGLFSDLTVLENIMVAVNASRQGSFIASMLGLPALRRRERQAREMAMALADRLGLSRDAGRQAGALPFGRQRLVEIARALATEPKVLMLDEPAAGLSGAEVSALAAVLRGLGRFGITICLVEHNMALVMAIADRILVLNHGQVLFHGTPAEVRRHPDVIAAYLGSAAGQAEVT